MRVGETVGTDAGVAWVQTRPRPAEGMTVGLGDLADVEVVIAASVGPANVVEQKQRQLGPRRALADQLELSADREVVVVSVDHDRIGQRQLRERFETRLADQLELGVGLGERDQPRLRGGVDRQHPSAGAGRPADEHPGQVTRESADLGDRPNVRRVQARREDLGHLGERDAPAVGVVEIRVELGEGLAHGGPV